MDRSLSELANNLPKEHFFTQKSFSKYELPLTTRKGVYPYHYTDSWEKLNEECLPGKYYFYKGLGDPSSLIQKKRSREKYYFQLDPIEDLEYEHAKMVWSRFNCQDLGSYSD